MPGLFLGGNLWCWGSWWRSRGAPGGFRVSPLGVEGSSCCLPDNIFRNPMYLKKIQLIHLTV